MTHPQRVFNGWDEFRAAQGTHLGYSRWLEVDQSMITAFADATDDHQWIHVDAERAANGPFGATIAHGFLTLSLLPTLMNDVFRIDGLSMAVNYGLNRVRFPSVVRVGSKLRGGVEFLDANPVALGNLVTLKFTVEADTADKPVCVAENLALMAA